MKNWLLLGLLLVCTSAVGADKVSTMRVIFRDYTVMDVSARPVSAGAVLWDTRELNNHPGIFASISPVAYGRYRLELGGCAVMNEKKARPEIAMLTGVSYQFTCNWIVGAWAAPFWNAYGTRPDDAWGIMIGYTFGVN